MTPRNLTFRGVSFCRPRSTPNGDSAHGGAAYLWAMPEPSASSGRAALSRELSEFLIELSIALHRHAMYPEGHPSLEPAATGVVRRADLLFVDRPTISLGVARNQLVIEGVATDPKHPVLRELAGRLHRHHLGAVTFSRGVDAAELTAVLQTLALEAERTGQPLGLGPADRLRAWPHVLLHPLTYERLELVDDGDGGAGAKGGEAATRSAQLWVGLARAALATGPTEEAPSTEPAAVAKSIDEHPRVSGYDQVIVGYLLQIADELKAAGGEEAVALRRRTSKLIKNLRPETLRALVDMGGDLAQRQKFALAATSGMAVDAVLEVVQAAAAASGQHISHGFLRLLTKLAAHAEGGTTGARVQADSALRDQVSRLISGWDLSDPNPGEYGAALQYMAVTRPVARASTGVRYEAEPLRVLQIAIETDQGGPAVWRALDDLLASAGDATLLDLLERAPHGMLAGAVWARVATPDRLARRLTAEPVDFAVVDRLVARLDPAAAAGSLLAALATAEARATRRALLDRLVRLGSPVVPLVIARLGDQRWYVVRNLLGLLQDLPGLPADFSAAPFAAHDDARVRREALRLQFRLPAERDQALVAALRDDDPRALQFALHAARQGCPPAALPVVIARARDRALDPDLRVLAIRVLGGTRAPQVVTPLLELCDGGTSLFGRRRLRPKSPELLAALSALAGWASDPRVAPVLSGAGRSEDPEVRAAAGGAARK